LSPIRQYVTWNFARESVCRVLIGVWEIGRLVAVWFIFAKSGGSVIYRVIRSIIYFFIGVLLAVYICFAFAKEGLATEPHAAVEAARPIDESGTGKNPFERHRIQSSVIYERSSLIHGSSH
jgi:hypothetical protein